MTTKNVTAKDSVSINALTLQHVLSLPNPNATKLYVFLVSNPSHCIKTESLARSLGVSTNTLTNARKDLKSAGIWEDTQPRCNHCKRMAGVAVAVRVGDNMVPMGERGNTLGLCSKCAPAPRLRRSHGA